MTWLVFIVGVVLAAIGGMSIYSGAPIIQIERGWAEVIAGSVAVSGGVVTLALGVVLLRLRDLHLAVVDAAAREVQPVASNADPVGSAPGAQRGEAEAFSTATFEETAGVGAADDFSPSFHERPDFAGTIHPEAERAAEEPGHIASEELQREAPISDAPEPVATLVDHEPAATPLPSAETLLGTIEPPRRLTAPSSDLTEADRERLREPAPLSRDWLSRPLLRARSRPGPPEPPPLYANPPEPEDAPPVSQTPEPASDLPPPSPAPVDAGAEPDLGDIAAQDPEVTVVGRYQAGASSYTMYSDGAIDVETEGGDIHRFDSMDELKAFIARQERALS